MITIQPLQVLTLTDLKRLASGYTSDSKFVVVHTSEPDYISFELQLIFHDKPYTKKFEHHDTTTLQQYQNLLNKGYSFGAYEGDLLVGLIISEPQEWNRSLWVWEFHVAETQRNQGIGKKLMENVVERAKSTGFRTIVCETQNTNVPAIKVYRKLGFRMEGIDISYYTNSDYPDGEIAVFMKRSL